MYDWIWCFWRISDLPLSGFVSCFGCVFHLVLEFDLFGATMRLPLTISQAVPTYFLNSNAWGKENKEGRKSVQGWSGKLMWPNAWIRLSHIGSSGSSLGPHTPTPTLLHPRAGNTARGCPKHTFLCLDYEPGYVTLPVCACIPSLLFL